MRHARAALALVVVLAAGCAGGAGETDSIVPPAIPLLVDSMSFTVKAGVNANRPVRVELVRVRDSRLVAELLRIENTAWFGAAGDEFRRKHPEALHDDWELVPGRAAGPFEVAVDARVAGVLFCGTRAGQPPIPVQRDGDLAVSVDDGDCVLGGGRPSREGNLWGGPGNLEPSILNPLKWFKWL